MMKSVWAIRFLLLLLILMPAQSGAKQRSRRQGSIAQAFQQPITTSSNSPFKSESFTVASTNKFSFEDIEPKEGSFTSSIPERSSPLDEEKVKEAEEKIATKAVTTDVIALPKGLQRDMPKELENEAKKALEVVEATPQDEEKIELQFQDADLYTFVKQIEELFNITFLTDEAIDPLPKGSPESPVKALKGNKITFKTNHPFNRKQAWDFFITFLDIAGFTVVPQPDPSIYRIQTSKAAQRAPLPTYIGTDYDNLPENDQLIRYLYFIENSTIDAMKNVLPALKSVEGSLIFLQEQKAFLITDKSYNIKSLMQIVKELDKVTMPQAMSVLKLHQTDAEEVKKLYDELTQTKEDQSPFRPFGARKQPTSIYFPENARIIAEPRTNSLILLGPKDAIAKIEDFITKHIDVTLDQPYSPLYTFQLRYADANNIAKIMTDITKFGQGTQAGQAGSVRGQDKYLKDMQFTPEPSTNQIIIKGDYEDYLIAKKILDDLDQPQPQIALEVLILTVDLLNEKQLGTQMRSKVPGLAGLLGQNVKFATSGLFGTSGIVQNTTGAGVDRLLGNILTLVSSAPAGNTIVTFGQDIFGVWGLFQVLHSITNSQVVANPFLVTSNKSKAMVSVGTVRRVTDSTVIAGSTQSPTQTDDAAKLDVTITPQINHDGMVILNLTVSISAFTSGPTSSTPGNKIIQLVDTQAVVADKEVLALGGLIRNTATDAVTRVPILGDIPLIGWLFKNQQKSENKTSLLILVQSTIIAPNDLSQINNFTQERMESYRIGSKDIDTPSDAKDPIHKLFVSQQSQRDTLGEFLFERHEKNRRRKGRKKSQKDLDTDILDVVQLDKKPEGIAPHISPAVPPAVTQIIAQNNATAPDIKLQNPTLKNKKRRSTSVSSMLSSEKTI